VKSIYYPPRFFSFLFFFSFSSHRFSVRRFMAFRNSMSCDADHPAAQCLCDHLSAHSNARNIARARNLVNLSISHSLRARYVSRKFSNRRSCGGFGWMDASITYSECASFLRPSPGASYPRHARSQIDPSTPRESRILTRKIPRRAQLLACTATKMDTAHNVTSR